MPVILSQRYIGAESAPKYRDVEGVIYHYPRVYFKRVLPDDRFIYYRPIKGSNAPDAGTYFGHGRLGVPFADMLDDSLRFVDIKGYQRFNSPVPLRDRNGRWIENATQDVPQFQAAVREISVYDYHRILISGGVGLHEVEALPTVDDIFAGVVSELIMAPVDTFRTGEQIPDGTGYVWHGDRFPNLAESAALQERARRDHQTVLRAIASTVRQRGGEWWFNNNVDLFAQIGEHRFLIEAKSLPQPAKAVDRMRYGMGQLFDYRVRYKADVAGATPVLAFGTPPARDDSWIATILDANNVAFVGLVAGQVAPLNQAAKGLAILS